MSYRDPFVGKRLQIYENVLNDRGTILDWTEADKVITFYTTKGEYSFYRVHPSKPNRNLRQLIGGDWKLHGDGPRWALVRPHTMADIRRW